MLTDLHSVGEVSRLTVQQHPEDIDWCKNNNTDQPDIQSTARQSCWILSPPWHPDETVFLLRIIDQLWKSTLASCGENFLPAINHSSSAGLRQERVNYSYPWWFDLIFKTKCENYLQSPAVPFCRSLNMENAGSRSPELRIPVVVLNWISLRTFTRLVRIPLMAPIL